MSLDRSAGKVSLRYMPYVRWRQLHILPYSIMPTKDEPFNRRWDIGIGKFLVRINYVH